MLRNRFVDPASAFIIVDTFEQNGAHEIEKFIKEQLCNTTYDGKTQVIIARTKADLNLPFVDCDNVMRFVRKWNIPFYNTSAKNDMNVCEVFSSAALLYFLNQRRKK